MFQLVLAPSLPLSRLPAASPAQQVWSGEYSVVVPNHLKRVVAQYAPMFSGYNQHDAGELMSFLLDGIHEDLNRVHKKVGGQAGGLAVFFFFFFSHAMTLSSLS